MKFFEGEKLEYKAKVTNQLVKEIIAFANTDGGKIYIGVNDDLSIKGIDDYDESLLAITNMIRDVIQPDLTMFIHYDSIMIDNKVILEIEIQRGIHRPYYHTKYGLKPSGVYVRQGSSSVPASESRIRELIKADDGDSFEKMRSLNQELTFEYARKELEKHHIELNHQSLLNMKMMNAEGLYTNLGLLLSDQCRFEIKVLRYSKNDHLQFQDRKIFSGSILQSMQEAYTYINLFNHLGSRIEGLQRVDRNDYPLQALREAFLNCIVHRDYSLKGSTSITIYDDKIEFLSFGGIVNGFTTNDIIAGASVCRNDYLANLFYRLNLIEGFGTGLRKIFECYQNSKTPLLEITDHIFKLTLFNQNGNLSYDLKSFHYTGNMVCEDQDEYNVITHYLGTHYTITRNDIEKLLQTSQATSNRILRRMLDEKKIKKVGKGKNTQYIKNE